MGPFKKGLNQKDHAAMMQMFRKKWSTKRISQHLQVAEKYVSQHRPAIKKKTKDLFTVEVDD